MQIGNRIKELRKSRHFSTLEMSIKAQISQSYLYELENNNKAPSLDTLEKICAALHVGLADFFDENIPELPPIEDEDPFTRRYYQLSPAHRKILDKLIDYMLESPE